MRPWYHAIADKLSDAASAMSASLPGRPRKAWQAAINGARWPDPYHLKGTPESTRAAGAAVFITARFRSGSTYLWTLLHHLGPFTVYYEPLHERRWFEDGVRDVPIDASHIGMTSYHTNYEGLESLAHLYDERWTSRRLFMEAGATDRKLQAYIQTLIDRADRQPVLQFNRVDFRLPWLRRNFSQARIFHLYRSPREQWVSSLRGEDLPLHVTLADFKPFDYFYLLPWWRDLRRVFDALRGYKHAHPYRAFYLLWRLSYLMARQYADVSVAYEQLAQAPAAILRQAFATLDIDCEGIAWDVLDGLTEYRAEPRWPAFAEPAWFEEVEQQVEEELYRMLHA